jgi:MHS family proline/betaine transporter-like MFS transporter
MDTSVDGSIRAPTTHDRRTLRRTIAASAIGNATEWFDYGVYAYATVFIAANFFPAEDRTSQIFSALLVFAVSFVIRPLGGLVWGPLGDRIGRRWILMATIVLMAGATFAVGVLPTYATIGTWAPILLVLLRVLQGFSTGGEYGGAATFMAEHAPDDRRGFFGSFLEFGTIAGFTAGALIVLATEYVIGNAAMYEWGWRLPFLVAGPLGLVGLYLRTKIEDTPVFVELAKEQSPTEQRWRATDIIGVWPQMLKLAGLVVALNVVNYTLLAYMPTYLQSRLELSSQAALSLVIVGQLAMMVAIPFAGALSDRVGRKPMWSVSLVGLFVLAVPMYWLMAQSFALALVGFTVLGLLYLPQLSTISATFPAMFPAHVRCAGMAIAYNVATSLFGGTAPAVNDWLIGATGDTFMPAYYMMGACAIGLLALNFVPETAGASLHGRHIPGVALESASSSRHA